MSTDISKEELVQKVQKLKAKSLVEDELLDQLCCPAK